MTVTVYCKEEEQDSSVSDDIIPSSEGRHHHHIMSLTYSDFIYPREQLSSEPTQAAAGNSAFSNNAIENGFEHIASPPPYATATSRLNLPNEFQVIDLDAPVPLLQNVDEVSEDFILICEFSELLGPIPLITIPFNAMEKTDINLNSLSVHVMFTDYQVNTVGQFKICDDTQVMRTNVFKDVHVFMQYFTLYDIKARGFVRPFCFGYVTKDHVKLETNLEKLISHFNKVTTILKCSNRIWFHGELKNYLNKLNNAKENYPFIRSYTPPHLAAAAAAATIESNGSNNKAYDPRLDGIIHHGTESYNSDTIDLDSCGDTISLQQIEHQFHEIENIFNIIDSSLKNVNNEPTNPTIISQLNQMETIFKSNTNPTTKTNCLTSQLITKLNFINNSFEELRLPFVHPLKRKDESLRPLTILGQFGIILFIQKLFDIRLQFKQDLIFDEITKLTDEFETHALEHLKEEEEESSDDIGSDENENEIDEEAIDISASLTTDDGGNGNGLGGMVNGASNCGIDIVVNETQTEKLSCAEVFDNKNVEILQVIEKLHYICPVASKSNHEDFMSCSFITSSDEDGTPTNQSVNENDMETSSYQTALRSVFDSQSQLLENEPNFDYGSSTIVFPTSVSTPSFSKQYQETPSQVEQPVLKTSGSLPTTLLEDTLLNSTPSSLLVREDEICTSTSTTIGSTSKNIPEDDTSNQASHSPIKISNKDKPLSPSSAALNLNDNSSSSCSGEDSIIEIEKKHWWTYAEKTRLTKHDPGYGILKFFRHFHTVAHHVLYSILIGRPVIIFGKETTRHKIHQIFNALIPFIPSYPSKTFKLLQWHQGILIPAYYKSFKLVGLCLPERLTIHDLINPHDLNFITLLDYETKKISGPAYSGYYFEQFGSNNNNYSSTNFITSKFFDDLSLITFIGNLLTEIQSQVFMCKVMLVEYYKKNNDNYDNFKSISKIMKQLSLKNSDSEIVKYLSGLLISPHDCTELF